MNKLFSAVLFTVVSFFCNAQYQDILPAAERGDAFSQMVMGKAYYSGSGIEKNYTKAFFMFEAAAKQNEKAAQCGLASCYENGYGVQQSYAKAFFWYKKSAEQGFTKAQYEVGKAYYLGRGCEKNNDLAIIWLRRACDNTSDEACNLLNEINSK